MIFDAHIHNKHHETGGFLIGLEGDPFFEGTLNNSEVLALHDPDRDYYSFYYVSTAEISKRISHAYLKYHPRREKYSPADVSESVKKNNPKAVILDTLNEPFWSPYDYWRIASDHPDVIFIMAHSGGYLINDFVKICHFQTNVWIDFALTHTTLGKLGDKETGLNYINDAIKYALHAPFKERVLLSSDHPFFDQDKVFDYYSDYHEMLNDNFKKLTKLIR